MIHELEMKQHNLAHLKQLLKALLESNKSLQRSTESLINELKKTIGNGDDINEHALPK